MNVKLGMSEVLIKDLPIGSTLFTKSRSKGTV